MKHVSILDRMRKPAHIPGPCPENRGRPHRVNLEQDAWHDRLPSCIRCGVTREWAPKEKRDAKWRAGGADERVPQHLNGCPICVHQYRKWTNQNKLQEAHRTHSRIYWFEGQGGYLELCPEHWEDIRLWLNDAQRPSLRNEIADALAFLKEHEPAPIVAQAPRKVITLEAFA